MSLVTLSAAANLIGANSLIVGYFYLRRHGRHREQWFINFSFLAFVVFLVSILICIYDINIQPASVVYLSYPVFSALLTLHITAGLFLPALVVFAVWVAITGRFRHYRRPLIVYWIFPTWMVVSLTGVVMYLVGGKG